MLVVTASDTAGNRSSRARAFEPRRRLSRSSAARSTVSGQLACGCRSVWARSERAGHDSLHVSPQPWRSWPALAFASCGHWPPANAPRTPHTPVPTPHVPHVIEQAPAGAPYSQLYASEPDFAAQMRWLQRNGYQAVTQRDVWTHRHRGAALPCKPIVISFDDGYRSVAQAALPQHALPFLARSPEPDGQEPARFSGGADRLDVDADSLGLGARVAHAHAIPISRPPDDALRSRARSRPPERSLRARSRAPIDFFCYPSGRFDDRVIRSASTRRLPRGDHDDRGASAIVDPDSPYELRRIRVSFR